MTMELVPYSETQRDALEVQLSEEKNKREINYRSSNGITVIAYYLMKEKVCLIFVHDERTNHGSEFEVPSDEVMEWFNHPYAHPDASLPSYEQRLNDA